MRKPEIVVVDGLRDIIESLSKVGALFDKSALNPQPIPNESSSVLIKNTDIHAASFGCEMWFATERRGQESGLLPSQRDDRKEGISVSVSTRSAHRISTHELIRGPKGDVIAVEPDWSSDGGDHFVGFNPLFGNYFTFFDDVMSSAHASGTRGPPPATH